MSAPITMTLRGRILLEMEGSDTQIELGVVEVPIIVAVLAPHPPADPREDADEHAGT